MFKEDWEKAYQSAKEKLGKMAEADRVKLARFADAHGAEFKLDVKRIQRIFEITVAKSVGINFGSYSSALVMDEAKDAMKALEHLPADAATCEKIWEFYARNFWKFFKLTAINLVLCAEKVAKDFQVRIDDVMLGEFEHVLVHFSTKDCGHLCYVGARVQLSAKGRFNNPAWLKDDNKYLFTKKLEFSGPTEVNVGLIAKESNWASLFDLDGLINTNVALELMSKIREIIYQIRAKYLKRP